MATEAPELTGFQQSEQSSELAGQWRRLTRAATFVAVLTAPAIVVWLNQNEGWAWYWSILAALFVVVCFRGLVDLIFHRMIPRPSLFGLESQQLREEDVVARRRVWFWRFWVKTAIWVTIIVVPFSLFVNTALLVQILPLLVMLPIFLIFNFVILFGPLLMMNLSQIQAFEPGDAEWGVKLADVRGQVEAKEEVRRVVSIWQSGEAFERAGGKRERGLLFLGAPGTGKTMLAKALATGFNSPFISIPGSGFAATFIGIDAIVVRVLARRAKRLAKKWGGQCIVFIDEIDAVGMRRQSLNPGFPGGGTHAPVQDVHRAPLVRPVRRPQPDRRPDPREPRVARAPLCGTRAAEHGSLGLLRPPRRRLQLHDARDGRRLAGAEPAPRRHGRHRQPAVLQEVLHEQVQRAARRHLHRAAADRQVLAPAAGRQAAQGADLLHRRHEHPRRAARPRIDETRPHGTPRLVQDADQAGPARRPRPLPGQGRPQP